MSRYSRLVGPAADFNITSAAFVLIPGMTLTRLWDDGELLIEAFAEIDHTIAGTPTVQVVPFLDGAQAGASIRMSLFTATQGTPAGSYLVALNQGLHTIDLRVAASAGAGDFVRAGRASLTVIQLPLWDSPANLITL